MARDRSALDAVFLRIESDRNPMHVGLTAIFEKGPLRSRNTIGETTTNQVAASAA